MKPERKSSKKSITNRERSIKLMTSIQRSLSPTFNNHHHHHLTRSTTSTQPTMLRLGSSNSIITSPDSDQDRVIFADPCSMCGTKKRRISLSPVHEHQDSAINRPLFQPSPPVVSSPESTQTPTPPVKLPTPPQSAKPYLAHLGSFSGEDNKFPVSTRQSDEQDLVLKNVPPSPDKAPSSASYLGRLGSFSTSSGGGSAGEMSPSASAPKNVTSPESQSPVNSQSSPTEGTYLNRLGSFSSSSGGGSPASASLPPRPQKILLRSVSDITPVRSSSRKRSLTSCLPKQINSSGGTAGGGGGGSGSGRSVTERREEAWKIMKGYVAVMNKLTDGLFQMKAETSEEEEEEEEEEEQVMVNKEGSEITTDGGHGGEEKDEEEGEAYFKGIYKCVCGRDLDLIFNVFAAK